LAARTAGMAGGPVTGQVRTGVPAPDHSFSTRPRGGRGAVIRTALTGNERCLARPAGSIRYGTVPAVWATGGMIDTVFDRDHSGHPRAERNGYVFHHTDNQAIESALSRALRLWSNSPREFRNLAVNRMRTDYSWARPGREYLDIYQHIEHR
jgi:hypothetical protein